MPRVLSKAGFLRALTEKEKAYLLEVLLEWIRRDLAKPAPREKVKKGETPLLF